MAKPEHAPHRAGPHLLGSTGPVRLRSRMVHQPYQAVLGPPANACDDLVGKIWLQEYGACDDTVGKIWLQEYGGCDDRQ